MLSQSEYAAIKARQDTARARRAGITPETIIERLHGDITIDCEPFPAVRTTRKGAHTPRAQEYHAKKEALEREIGTRNAELKRRISAGCEIVFLLPIP